MKKNTQYKPHDTSSTALASVNLRLGHYQLNGFSLGQPTSGSLPAQRLQLRSTYVWVTTSSTATVWVTTGSLPAQRLRPGSILPGKVNKFVSTYNYKLIIHPLPPEGTTLFNNIMKCVSLPQLEKIRPLSHNPYSK